MITTTNYIVRKAEGGVTVENLHTGQLSYTVSSVSCSGSTSELEQGTIDIGQTFPITFNADGRYILNLSIIIEVGTTTLDPVWINHYPVLRREIVSGLESIICKDKCNCNCCGTCNSNCIEIANLYNSYMLYKALAIPGLSILEENDIYFTLIDRAVNGYLAQNKCDLLDNVCTIYTDLSIEGKQNLNIDLASFILSSGYLALRLYERILSDNEDYLEYIDRIYNYNKISKCIIKQGVNITTIEDIADVIQNNIQSNSK